LNRDRPLAFVEIDFRPQHFGHLGAALPEQEKELLQRAEGVGLFHPRCPKGFDLVFRERSVAYQFLYRRLHCREWRCLNPETVRSSLNYYM